MLNVEHPGEIGPRRLPPGCPAWTRRPCSDRRVRSRSCPRRARPGGSHPTATRGTFPMRLRPHVPRSLAFLALVAPVAAAERNAPTSLEILPSDVRLHGPAAVQHLVIIGSFADGSRLDL